MPDPITNPTAPPIVPTAPAPTTPPTPVAPPAPSGQDPLTPGTVTDPAAGDAGKTFDEAYVKQLRDEAAASRVKARDAELAQAATLDAIAQALGLKGNEQPDPAALAQQLTAAQVEARQLKIERAVEKAARACEADEDLVTAVLAHGGKLAALDPSAGDFATAVEALVKTTVDANPRLKSTAPAPGAGRSGGDFPGGPTAPPAPLDVQIAAAKKAGQIHEVIRLENLKLANGGQ
jgi:hypothetical protein